VTNGSEQIDAPPIGEELHLPDSSLQPLAIAFGTALMLVGLTLSPILIVFGAVFALVALVRWIRAARHELGELPPDAH
jgi:hypothetical protein